MSAPKAGAIVWWADDAGAIRSGVAWSPAPSGWWINVPRARADGGGVEPVNVPTNRLKASETAARSDLQQRNESAQYRRGARR